MKRNKMAVQTDYQANTGGGRGHDCEYGCFNLVGELKNKINAL